MTPRLWLVVVGVAGELLLGGLVFGWQALSVVLKALGVYAQGCRTGVSGGAGAGDDDTCDRQESKLSVIWTAGTFAVNFGPAIIGPFLDAAGPRVVAVTGATVAVGGLLTLAFGTGTPTSLLPLGAAALGFGGLAYHLAQFNNASLFPSKRGLVSSIYVGSFILSGLVWEIERALFSALGGTERVYRILFVAHACVSLPVIALMCWMAPARAFQAGQTLMFQRGCFHAVAASEELKAAGRPQPSGVSDGGVSGSGGGGAAERVVRSSCLAALAAAAPMPDAPGAPAKQGAASEAAAPKGPTAERADDRCDGVDRPASSPSVTREGSAGGLSDEAQGEEEFKRGERSGKLHSPTNSRAAAGLESSSASPSICPRWQRLAALPVRHQLRSPEFWSLGTLFALNVLVLQTYLGTARVQLEELGDTGGYLRALNIIVPCAGFLAPLSGLLLDRLGYSATLLLTNVLSIATSTCQLIPHLPAQLFTAIFWALARYLLQD